MKNKNLLVLTPYYPNDTDKVNGLFIKQQINLIKNNFHKVIIFKYKSVALKNLFSDIYNNKLSYYEDGVKVFNLFYLDNHLISRIFKNKMIATKIQIKFNYYLRCLFFVKFNVILSQWLIPSTYIFSFLPKRKIISVVRGMDINILREQFPKYFMYALKKSDIIVGNGKYVSSFINKINKYSIVETIYNPKKLDVFLNLNLRKKRLINEFNFTCVGRFDGSKRHDLLVRLVYELKLNGIKINLKLIGTGINLENIKKLTFELGVDTNVNFLSNLSHYQLAEVFSNTDIYLQPSMREGVPNALAEAMASGCCCIARDVGGVSDLITDKINGYLFNNDDEFTTLVKKVLESDNFTVRENARRKTIEIFNNQLNINKLMKHLNE